jgi:hypothetical protein
MLAFSAKGFPFNTLDSAADEDDQLEIELTGKNLLITNIDLFRGGISICSQDDR